MERTDYLNQLQRGYEIATGRETPLLDIPQRIGREDELLAAWHHASAEDRDWIETANRETDQFIKDQGVALDNE